MIKKKEIGKGDNEKKIFCHTGCGSGLRNGGFWGLRTGGEPEGRGKRCGGGRGAAASDAKLESGSQDGVEQTPKYLEEENAISDMITGASAIYTVPDGVDGTYDIYLQVGKATSMVGTTIFDVVVNDEDRYVLRFRW